MTGKYAWLGNRILKEEILSDLADDRARERFVQGSFIAGANDHDQAFFGCHIGCLMMARARYQNRRNEFPVTLPELVASNEENAASWHSDVPDKLGIPQSVAEFWDKFFEKLSPALAPRFAVESLECVPVGADLSCVLPGLVAWLLSTFLDGAELTSPEAQRLSVLMEAVAGAWRARAQNFDGPSSLGVGRLEDEHDELYRMVNGFKSELDPTFRFHWTVMALVSASSGAIAVHTANAVIDEWLEAIIEEAFPLPKVAEAPFDFADEAVGLRDVALWMVADRFFHLCAAAPQGQPS